MTTVSPIQAVSTVVLISILTLLYRWAKHDTSRTLWALPVAVWLGHGLLFYIVTVYAAIFKNFPPGYFTVWSSILRLHAYFTILFIVYTLVRLNGRVDHHE